MKKSMLKILRVHVKVSFDPNTYQISFLLHSSDHFSSLFGTFLFFAICISNAIKINFLTVHPSRVCLPASIPRHYKGYNDAVAQILKFATASYTAVSMPCDAINCFLWCLFPIISFKASLFWFGVLPCKHCSSEESLA